jgi:taurine dioxygenase
MAFTLTPLTHAIGVEVTGIDLCAPLAPRDREALENALIEHLVMVVRGQDYSAPTLLDAVGHFGVVMHQHITPLLMEGYPQIAVLNSRETKVGADGKFVPIGARDWHTDHAHHERPPNYTALYAVTLPSSGGDTSFANMQRGFASLPSQIREDLVARTVVTKIDDRYSSLEDQKKFNKPRTHPLVRTHPITGKKAIYFHPGMVARLEGMETDASLEFLDDLLSRVITPEISYRHKWCSGDMVICDNRSVMHIAHRDYDPAIGRVLHRILVEGETPF